MIKKYTKIILFTLLHLIASIIVFFVFKINYNEGNVIYESLSNSNLIIIELSTVIITILSTYEFLIKQLHFSRYSEKIVEKNMKFYYSYAFLFMLLCIVINCLFNEQKSVTSAISFVLLFSLVVFLLIFLLLINRNTLDKIINNKTKSIKQNINRDKFKLKINDFTKLYKESVFKEEYEVAKKLIIDYSSIVEEMLKNKSKILSSEKMSPRAFEEKMDNLLFRFEQFIIKEKNNFATEMNKTIISKLLRLYKQKKKFDQETSNVIMKQIKKILILDNTLYEVEPLFRVYLGKILDDDNTISVDEFDECLGIFSSLLTDGRIAEPYMSIRYIFYCLDNLQISKKNLIEIFIRFREKCLLHHSFDGLFNFTRDLDNYCFEKNEYEKCVNSYERLIKYSSFYSNENKIKSILLLFDDLINDSERKKYNSNFYSMYFEVVGKSFKKIDFIPNMIVPNYSPEDFNIIYDDLCRITYSSIMYENDSYLYHILSTVNKKTFEKDNLLDGKIFDFYDEIFGMMSQSSNQNLLNLIISMYIELYEKLDKDRKLEDKQAGRVIDVVLSNLEYFVTKQNKNSYLFEKIFFDLVSTEKDYHFVKKEYQNIIVSLYKEAYLAIEYSDSKVIKFISNIMAWETKKGIDDGTNPSTLFKNGLNLLDTLISVNYTEEVIIFVGTFITTIWAYAKSSSNDFKINKNKLRFNAYRDVNDKMVMYLIKSIALRKNISKEWNNILNAKKYDESLTMVEQELFERKKQMFSKKIDNTIYTK